MISRILLTFAMVMALGSTVNAFDNNLDATTKSFAIMTTTVCALALVTSGLPVLAGGIVAGTVWDAFRFLGSRHGDV